MDDLYIKDNKMEKPKKDQIEKAIMDLLVKQGRSRVSIREVTLKLREDYDIRLSAPIVKRYLFKLKREGRIE